MRSLLSGFVLCAVVMAGISASANVHYEGDLRVSGGAAKFQVNDKDSVVLKDGRVRLDVSLKAGKVGRFIKFSQPKQNFWQRLVSYYDSVRFEVPLSLWKSRMEFESPAHPKARGYYSAWEKGPYTQLESDSCSYWCYRDPRSSNPDDHWCSGEELWERTRHDYGRVYRLELDSEAGTHLDFTSNQILDKSEVISQRQISGCR